MIGKAHTMRSGLTSQMNLPLCYVASRQFQSCLGLWPPGSSKAVLACGLQAVPKLSWPVASRQFQSCPGLWPPGSSKVVLICGLQAVPKLSWLCWRCLCLVPCNEERSNISGTCKIKRSNISCTCRIKRSNVSCICRIKRI